MSSKRKNWFPQETVDSVITFYKNEQVSRFMAEKKQKKTNKTIKVWKLDQRVQEQKYDTP